MEAEGAFAALSAAGDAVTFTAATSFTYDGGSSDAGFSVDAVALTVHVGLDLLPAGTSRNHSSDGDGDAGADATLVDAHTDDEGDTIEGIVDEHGNPVEMEEGLDVPKGPHEEAASSASSSGPIDMLMEYLKGDNEAKRHALDSLRGSVVCYAFDEHGCRAVQLAFQVADTKVAAELLSELRGHVYAASRS